MMYRVTLGREVFPGQFEYRADGCGFVIEGCSRQPLLDACREIKRMGGDTAADVALFHEGSDQWAIKCTVGWGAVHTTDENAKGVRFAKWKPFLARLRG